MTRKISTRIMRVGLEEVVGNHQPPDLTDRILAMMAESPDPVDARTQAILDATAQELQAARPSLAKPALVQPASQRPTERPTQRWTAIAVALSVVVFAVLSVVVLLAIRQSLQAPQIADDSPTNAAPPEVQPDVAPTDGDSRFNRQRPQLANRSPGLPGSNPTELAFPRTIDPGTERSQGPTVAQESRRPWRDRTPPAATYVAARLKEQFSEQWNLVGVTPANNVDDLTWAKRLFAVLIGRSPDPYELARLEAQLPLSRPTLAQELMTGEKYRDSFTGYWSQRLATHLLGGKEGRNQALVSPDAFAGYLQQQLANQQGLDAIVVSLLTAQGNALPNQDDFNPATSFLVSLNDGKGIHATNTVMELFWNQNAKCARCHDHHAAGGMSQDDFWRINSHFRQLSMQGNQESGVRLLDEDFLGELQDPAKAAVFYENEEKRLVAAFPKFSEGIAYPTSGQVEEFNRRQALASAIVSDIKFPRAMVNWAWSEVHGFPLTSGDPQSDAQSQAAFKMLDELAVDFAASRFDLEQLLQWIILSPPMGLESTPFDRLAADAPWYGQPALFSFWYPQQRRYESVDQGLALMDRAHQQGAEAVVALRNDLPGALEIRNTGDRELQADVDPQAGLNWRLVRNGWLVSDEQAELLHRMVVSPLTEEQKIEHVFELAIGRSPTNAQMRMVKKWLKDETGNPLAVYQDLWWTLHRSR